MRKNKDVVHLREQQRKEYNPSGVDMSVNEKGTAASEAAESDDDKHARDNPSFEEGCGKDTGVEVGESREDLPKDENRGVGLGEEEVPIHCQGRGGEVVLVHEPLRIRSRSIKTYSTH